MNIERLEWLARNTDLGVNVHHLHARAAKYSGVTFVDCGVAYGNSSEILLTAGVNNKVVGVDVAIDLLRSDVRTSPNWRWIMGDSVTVGTQWRDGPIHGLFIDNLHNNVQVICELYFWYEHIAPGGFIGFHDTHWEPGRAEYYGGVPWGRPEQAVLDFFQMPLLDHEDEWILSRGYPQSLSNEGYAECNGMTIIEVKKKRDYRTLRSDWSQWFAKRNELMAYYWPGNNGRNVQAIITL
jgi:hypothetical protein